MIRPLLLLLLASAGLASAAGPGRTAVVATREAPVSAVEITPGRWFFDFGLAAFGNVEISGKNLPAGRELTVHLGEALKAPRQIDPNPGGTIRYQKAGVTLDPAKPAVPRLTWAPPGWLAQSGAAYLKSTPGMGEVIPFRYAEIENAPAGFTAAHVRRVIWHVPFDDNASSFTSSAPELNRVWDICKHTMKATSAFGVYIDGDRERRPYEADILINQLGHYCTDAHYETARHSIDFIIAHPTWPTEWRLQTPMLAWLDCLWSGDDSTIRRHYDTLVGRSMIDRRHESGHFIGSNQGDPRDIIDWPESERDGFEMQWPVKSPVTAFHHRALIDMASIASRLGKSEDAARFTRLAGETKAAFNRDLWDETKGRYADGFDPANGNRSGHASAHANFFPLALGLVPDERIGSVADFLETKGMACSVYGAQFLVEALYLAGRDEAALKLLRSDDKRSWRNMIETVGATMTLEAWDPSFKPNLDFNHPWGAAPANLIPRMLMGIEPLEPGFTRFRVQPRTASLDSAAVKLPTPRGPIELRITRSPWTAELTVPPGSTAEFHLPSGTREFPPGKHRITDR